MIAIMAFAVYMQIATIDAPMHSPSVEIDYQCVEIEGKKFCRVSKEQLETLIYHNNEVTAKLKWAASNKACRIEDVVNPSNFIEHVENSFKK